MIHQISNRLFSRLQGLCTRSEWVKDLKDQLTQVSLRLSMYRQNGEKVKNYDYGEPIVRYWLFSVGVITIVMDATDYLLRITDCDGEQSIDGVIKGIVARVREFSDEMVG